MTEGVPMTQEAYDKLLAEVDHMENVELAAITEKVAEAREEGDLKENAEYHGQREMQGMMRPKSMSRNTDLPTPLSSILRILIATKLALERLSKSSILILIWKKKSQSLVRVTKTMMWESTR